MLRYESVPLDTFFVIVTETHNPQLPFVRTRGGLYQLMEVLTESTLIKFLPVPRDVAEALEKNNPCVVCVSMPIKGPIGRQKPERRYYQGIDSDPAMRRALKPLLAGLPGTEESSR